jgi:hypothetical protein
MIRRSIFSACLISLSVVAVFGSGVSSASATILRHHYSSMPVYYNYAMPTYGYGLPIYYYTGVGGPLCYLPSDGCNNNYTVTN